MAEKQAVNVRDHTFFLFQRDDIDLAVAVLFGQAVDRPSSEFGRHGVDRRLVGKHLVRPGLALVDIARDHDWATRLMSARVTFS